MRLASDRNRKKVKGRMFQTYSQRWNIKCARTTSSSCKYHPLFLFRFNLQLRSLSLTTMSKFLALASLVALASATPVPRQAAGKGPQLPSPYPPPPHFLHQMSSFSSSSGTGTRLQMSAQISSVQPVSEPLSVNFRHRLNSHPFPINRIRLRSSKSCRGTHSG